MKWIYAVGSVISAIAAVLAVFKIQEIHLILNSRLTELIAASHAKGRQDERDSNKEVK